MHTTALALAILISALACILHGLQAEELRCSLSPGTSTQAPEVVGKKALVMNLVTQLASEEYAEREAAEAELIKMGLEVLPAIVQAEKVNRDPEVLLRLGSVRTELRFAAATTLDSSMELWKSFVEEALAVNVNPERVAGRLELADRAMDWIEKFAPDEKTSVETRSRRLGNLYYEHWKKLNDKFCVGRSGLVLDWAIFRHVKKYATAAEIYFRKVLDINPTDKETEERRSSINLEMVSGC